MSQNAPAKPTHGNHWPIVIGLVGGIGVGMILQKIAHPAEGAAPEWIKTVIEACRFVSDLFLRG